MTVYNIRLSHIILLCYKTISHLVFAALCRWWCLRSNSHIDIFMRPNSLPLFGLLSLSPAATTAVVNRLCCWQFCWVAVEIHWIQNQFQVQFQVAFVLVSVFSFVLCLCLFPFVAIEGAAAAAAVAAIGAGRGGSVRCGSVREKEISATNCASARVQLAANCKSCGACATSAVQWQQHVAGAAAVASNSC